MKKNDSNSKSVSKIEVINSFVDNMINFNCIFEVCAFKVPSFHIDGSVTYITKYFEVYMNGTVSRRFVSLGDAQLHFVGLISLHLSRRLQSNNINIK